MTSRRVDPKAFTLIEILVSLTIVAILLAILSPCLSAAREAGRLTSCVASERQCGLAVWAYQTDTKTLPPAPPDPQGFDWEMPASVFVCADQAREHPGYRNVYHPGEMMTVAGILDPTRLWTTTRHFEEHPSAWLWLENIPLTADNHMPPGPHSGRWSHLRYDLSHVMITPPPVTMTPSSGD